MSGVFNLFSMLSVMLFVAITMCNYTYIKLYYTYIKLYITIYNYICYCCGGNQEYYGG